MKRSTLSAGANNVKSAASAFIERHSLREKLGVARECSGEQDTCRCVESRCLAERSLTKILHNTIRAIGTATCKRKRRRFNRRGRKNKHNHRRVYMTGQCLHDAGSLKLTDPVPAANQNRARYMTSNKLPDANAEMPRSGVDQHFGKKNKSRKSMINFRINQSKKVNTLDSKWLSALDEQSPSDKAKTKERFTQHTNLLPSVPPHEVPSVPPHENFQVKGKHHALNPTKSPSIDREDSGSRDGIRPSTSKKRSSHRRKSISPLSRSPSPEDSIPMLSLRGRKARHYNGPNLFFTGRLNVSVKKKPDVARSPSDYDNRSPVGSALEEVDRHPSPVRNRSRSSSRTSESRTSFSAIYNRDVGNIPTPAATCRRAQISCSQTSITASSSNPALARLTAFQPSVAPRPRPRRGMRSPPSSYRALPACSITSSPAASRASTASPRHSRSGSRTRTRPHRHSSDSRSRSSSASSRGSSSRRWSDSERSSRSPSIPIRNGSPSFMERRRITSARKRPIPYKRVSACIVSSSECDSDSSEFSRSPTHTPSPLREARRRCRPQSASPRRNLRDDSSSPLRKRRDGSSSPLRKRRDGSSSPLRKRRDGSTSPLIKIHNSYLSPPRKRRHNYISPSRRLRDNSQSPSRNRRDSYQPPQRNRRDSHLSPQRNRRDSHLSPLRNRRDSHLSPLRNRRDSCHFPMINHQKSLSPALRKRDVSACSLKQHRHYSKSPTVKGSQDFPFPPLGNRDESVSACKSREATPASPRTSQREGSVSPAARSHRSSGSSMLMDSDRSLSPHPQNHRTFSPHPQDHGTFSHHLQNHGTLSPHTQNHGTFSPHPQNHGTFSPHPQNHGTFSPHPQNHGTFSPHPQNHGTFSPHPQNHGTFSSHPQNHGTFSPHPQNHGTFSPHPQNHGSSSDLLKNSSRNYRINSIVSNSYSSDISA